MSETLSTSQNNTNNSDKSLENVIVSSENNTNKEDPAATAAGLPAGWVSMSGKDGAKTLANLFSKASLNK